MRGAADASLASRGSRFGPGVVFRGRGLGPGVVSGVFFQLESSASRPRPPVPFLYIQVQYDDWAALR